jgi:hypothetical protein
MSFLDSINVVSVVGGVIKNEKEMLRAMREAAEKWYNELTEPFLVILQEPEHGPGPVLTVEQRSKLAKLANAMLCAEFLINNGEALDNKLAEIEKNCGIPWFSGRTELKEKATEYLNSGVFLKPMAYVKAFRDQDTSKSDYLDAVQKTRDKWRHFRDCKDALVDQINSQLARIG